jgi:ABC-2 type transport system permease protein
MIPGEFNWHRLRDEIAQAWTIMVKDIRVYYLTPPMVMFGVLLPFFLFFSFSVQRQGSVQASVGRLLAMNVFFTASSAGPVIIPLERRMGTYDRLLVAPMSLLTLLLGKTAVGTVFALLVSVLSSLVGSAFLGAAIQSPLLLLPALFLGSVTFAALGLVFGSIPTQSVGSIMMPSTLVRWPLLFISGVFVPLEEMSPWLRALSCLSPLTFAQDLIGQAVSGRGHFSAALDLLVLALFVPPFLLLAAWLHKRSRVLGS